MSSQHFIRLLKAEARKAQKATNTIGMTGRFNFGPIQTRYYPSSGRYGFWLNSENATVLMVRRWFREAA